MVAVTPVTVLPVDMAAALAANRGANWDTDDDSADGWKLVDAANGNKFTCTGREIVLFRHADNSTLTITIESAPCDQGHFADHAFTKTMAPGNAKEQFCALGFIGMGHYAKTVDTIAYQVKITYSGTATATAIRVISIA